ncbi:MAG: Hpt domain-containing protein [Bdellovibrionota bacterium]
MTNKMPLINAEAALLYLQQAPAKVNEFENQLRSRKFGPMAAAARQLRASSINLGALELSELLMHIEDSARHKDVENLLRLLPKLKTMFGEVRTELERISSGTVKKAA